MMLRTEKISKHFDGLRAVDQVDFTLKPGQLKSIIGPNGAGKTTLFNLIAGVHRATGGKVFFRDRDITGLSLHQTSRLGITKTYQVTHIFPGLTVFENVRIAAQSRLTAFNFWRTTHSLTALNEKALGILEQVELLEKRSWLASTLSHGERRYLEIGIALATEPQVLLLDEPTAGMSVAETRQCAGLIQTVEPGPEAFDRPGRARHERGHGDIGRDPGAQRRKGPRGRDASAGERQPGSAAGVPGRREACLG